MRDRYRELIAALPIPTEEQTANFAAYVVGAHSWYKHLPCTPPGAPFAFFLDPNAGRELVLTEDRAEYHDRTNGQQRFHYTWMLTTEYRARFGHWEYATNRGTTLIARLPGGGDPRVVGPGVVAQVLTEHGGTIPVSPEVLAAGTMAMTAHVHEYFDAGKVGMLASVYRRSVVGADDPKHSEWDREKQALIDLWERHEDDLPALDRELDEERARLRAELHATLLRLRAFLASW